MLRILFVLAVFAILSTAIGAKSLMAEEYITLNLPESVITKAAAAILPLHIDAHSEVIQGDIQIINISEIRLTNGHLACRLHLTGKQLALLTEIAGHEIKLQVGSVEIDFKTDAAIRFDAKKQILYVKPLVKNVAANAPGSDADIGQALVGLLNGQEFPINMQELDPLIARAGSKTITINSTIADIQARPQAIQLSLRPQVSAR